MAWISVHQPIRDHRKIRELFRILKIRRAEAIGTLVLIWTWAIDNCDQHGKLLSCTIEDLANAAYWTKSPKTLYSALVEAGWIDEINGEMYLHDWDDFNKPFYDYVARKEKDKKRKRNENSNGNPMEIPMENMRKLDGNSTEIPEEFHDSHSPAHSPAHSHSHLNPLKSMGQNDLPRTSKHKYGEFQHVLLADFEKDQFIDEFGNDIFNKCIQILDEYIETSGKKYKNHNLVMRRWVLDEAKKPKGSSNTSNSFIDDLREIIAEQESEGF